MLRNFKRVISFILMAAVMIGLMAGITVRTVFAAELSLAELAEEGKLKLLGRTEPYNGNLLADWPGNGFEMNVSGNGGIMEVGFSSNYDVNWAVLVDGEQVYFERISKNVGKFTAQIPAGSHVVSVIKESDNNGKATDYCNLTTLSFPGTIENAPAYKETLIEFVGDSYTAGWGTLGSYAPGYKWPANEHSFTHGFAYYCSQILNVDYSSVSRGGIGLFDGVSAMQPDDDPDATIADIYPYTAGFRQAPGEYIFAQKPETKQPDVIVIEIGANDGIKEGDANFTGQRWMELLNEFTDLVRQQNPDTPIVYLSHRGHKFYKVMQVLETRKAAGDENLYAFGFAHQGNGSGSANQTSGHPNAEDSYALAKALSAFLQENGLVSVQKDTQVYEDLIYYVSESGSDSNNGKSITTAKKSLSGALKQAKADNPSMPTGSRVVVNLQGTVTNSTNNTTVLGDSGGTLLSVDGKRVPVLVKTYNYGGEKAVLDTGHKPPDKNSNAMYCVNDITFQDIVLQSTTNTANGTRDNLLYTGYSNITFDNVTFAQVGSQPTAHTDNGWIVSATHFLGSAGVPAEPTTIALTFLNGDYTNLDFAAVVYRDSMWRSKADGGDIYNCPTLHSKLVIGQGAHMGKVYNRYGKIGLAASTVEVCGGTIDQYLGTCDGTSAAAKVFEGDVNFVMTSGLITGDNFFTTGNYVTIHGDINNTVSGGRIHVRCTAFGGIFFGGKQNVTMNNLTNTVSGGSFLTQAQGKDNIDTCISFGGRSNITIQGDLTNKISGGSYTPIHGQYTTKGNMYFAGISGKIGGTLYNEIKAGSFDMTGCKVGRFYLGFCNVNGAIGKQVNVLGQKDSSQGPVFVGAEICMAAGWAQIGTASAYTAMPEVSQCTDEVVLSNTIYSGHYDQNIYLTPFGAPDLTNKYYNFVLGSVQNDIYGGLFPYIVYAAGRAPVYGKVTTNIHGGVIRDIYGAGIQSKIYDGVELNIYGVTEYYTLQNNNKDSWRFYAGAQNADIPVPQTQGRPSVKLTVAPAGALTLHTPLMAGCNGGSVLGDTVVEVSGGIYPKGFRVDGVTLTEALKDGYMPVGTDGQVIVPDEVATETGTAQVTVQKVYKTYASCDPAVDFTYTTDPNGATEERPSHVLENGICVNCGFSGAEPMDLNGDGRVTVFDAQLLAEAKAGLRTLTEQQWQALGDTTVQDMIDQILGR